MHKSPDTISVGSSAVIGKFWFYPRVTGTDRCAGCVPYRKPASPPSPWWWHITRGRPLTGHDGRVVA